MTVFFGEYTRANVFAVELLLVLQELQQLAEEVRSQLCSGLAAAQKPSKASLAVVELTVAIHHVFHAPADKILWDVGEQVSSDCSVFMTMCIF